VFVLVLNATFGFVFTVFNDKERSKVLVIVTFFNVTAIFYNYCYN